MSRWTDFRNKGYLWFHRLKRADDTFDFHGIDVYAPESVGLTARYKIFRGRYERQEVEAIRNYLSGDFDVIELGGSIGAVSALVSSTLWGRRCTSREPVRHVVVEANPLLIPVLEKNLISSEVRSKIITSAISYSSTNGFVDFWYTADDNLVGSIQSPDARATCHSVPAVRLSDILFQEKINDYSLICDIEGGELELFTEDTVALGRCQLAIVELHPAILARQGASTETITGAAAKAGLSKVDQFDDVYVFRRIGGSR